MLLESLSSSVCHSHSSVDDFLQCPDEFAVPGPDRPKPMYNSDWRQNPPISPRRGKHYNSSVVGPYVRISVYRPTRFFGRLLKTIWNELPIWELAQTSIDINEYLPVCLHPVPLPTLIDHIKHQTLCAKPIIWLVRRSQVQAHPKCQIINKKQLINQLLPNHKYNFVLLGDGRLVFARIPHIVPKLPYRLLSKHVGLAKSSSNVRFAGELRISDDRETLFVNNDSGTYRPDDRMLPSAVAYLQKLFPQISLCGVPRK